MKIYDRFSSFQIPTARSYIFSRTQPGSRVSVVGGNQYFRSMAVVGVEGPVWQGLKGTSRTNKWKILVVGSSKRVQDELRLKAMGHDVLLAFERRKIKLNIPINSSSTNHSDIQIHHQCLILHRWSISHYLPTLLTVFLLTSGGSVCVFHRAIIVYAVLWWLR